MTDNKIDVSMLGIEAHIEVSKRRCFNRPHLGLWVDGEWYGWYYNRNDINQDLKPIIYEHWKKKNSKGLIND